MSRALRAGCVVWLAGFTSAIAVGGCTSRVQSDPTTFEVRQDASSRMRGQQGFSVNNAYATPTVVVAYRRDKSKLEIDLRDFTETAVGMMERRMRKDGIDVAAGATKSVVLRIKDVSVLSDGFAMLSTVTMEAELGNGARKALRVKNNSTSAQRALDGAMVRGVTQLLNDEEFLAYVNGP
jgi:hypothetical protein